MIAVRRGLPALLAAGVLAGCVRAPSPAQRVLRPAPTPPASGETVNSTVARQLDASIRVRAVTCAGLSIGSSFAVDPTTLVTNRHVVSGASSLQLDTAGGASVSVRVAGSAYVQDLAIVRTATPVSPVLRLAAADPRVGTPVSAVGYPRGGPPSVTGGTVLRYQVDPLQSNASRVILTDAYVTHGNSGGPLLNGSGQVVGVIYAGDSNGHSLAIPVSALRRVLADRSSLGPVRPCGSTPTP